MTFKKYTPYFPLSIFFISFSIYLFTSFPSTYWRDTPEFQTIGFLLDIAHPSGSPLYAIIAKLFTFIPIGSIAFKTTLLSSVFGAGVSVLVYLIILMIFELISKKKSESLSPGSLCVIAFLTTLTFSFSNALWENARATEVYTFQNFFTAIFILLLLKVQLLHKEKSVLGEKICQIFIALSFLLGLSLGAHSILILYLPFLVVFVYFRWIRLSSLHAIKMYSLLCFFFLLGFSVFLYLPIRSAQDPHYDWGNPETFFNFLIHISDRKDASYHFSLPEPLLDQFLLYSKLFLSNFSFLGFLIGGAGLLYLIRKGKKEMLVVFVLFSFPPFIFFIRYWRWHSAFIPTFLIFTLFIAVGVWLVVRKCGEWQSRYGYNKSLNTFIFSLIGIQFFLLFSSHLASNSNTDYWVTRDIYRSILNDVRPDAVIFMVNTSFGLTYLQKIEGFRPDVTAISVVDFIQPRVFTEILDEKYPLVVIPSATKGRLGPIFIKANIQDHPIYWEPTLKYNKFVLQTLVPDGFLFRISEKKIATDVEINTRSLNKLKDKIYLEAGLEDEEEKTFFWNILNGQGMYYYDTGYYPLALGYFELARALIPDDIWSLKMIGAAHSNLGHFEEAEAFFLKALSFKSKDSEVYRSLGGLYELQGKILRAEKSYLRAVKINPEDLSAQYSLGHIREERGELREALAHFEHVMTIDPGFQNIQERINLIKQELIQ